MEYIEISAKTVDDCITDACIQLSVTSDKLDYEVIQQPSIGLFGFNVKPAIIKAKVKSEEKPVEENAIVEEKVVKEKKSEKTFNSEKKKNNKPEKAVEVKEEVTDEKPASYVYDNEFINKAKRTKRTFLM